MSLKALHVAFVTVSTILAVGFGIWAIRNHNTNGDRLSPVIGVGSLTIALGLIFYDRWFINKLKGVRCI